MSTTAWSAIGAHTADPRTLVAVALRRAPRASLLTLACIGGSAAAAVVACLASVRLLIATTEGRSGATLVATGVLVVAIVLGESLRLLASLCAARAAQSVERWMRGAALRHALVPGGRGPAPLADLRQAAFPPEVVADSAASIACRLAAAAGGVALTWVLGWWVPLVVLVAHLVSRRRNRRMFDAAASSTVDEKSLAASSYLVELSLRPAVAREWRLFGLQRFVIAELRAEWRRLTDALAGPRRSMRRSAVVSTAAVAAATTLVLLVAATEARQGRLGFADFVLLVQALFLARGLVGFSSADMVVGSSVGPLAAAVRQVEHAPSPPGRTAAPLTGVAPAVRLDEVRFEYGNGGVALDGLTLDVPRGALTVVVGENGAGKSTMLNLMHGLARPTQGQVTADGAPLDLDEGWCGRLAVVRQDLVRYPFTVTHNVTLGAPARDYEVDQILSRVGLADHVSQLPHGRDTELGTRTDESQDLSGGQWQRLAIARALFAVSRGADIVLLDEPTSHLDAESEHTLLETFLDELRGCTVVLVLHRLALARKADQVVVVAGGRVVERGTHDELLRLDRRYATAWRTQADRYVQEASR